MRNSFMILLREKQQNEDARKLLPELQDYLRSKLRIVKVNGQFSRYTCKEDNRFKGKKIIPFKHMKNFCEARNIDWEDFKDWIEDITDSEINFESQLVNDGIARKHARLRRFGMDIDELKR